MSYQLSIQNNIVCVRFIGVVDGLQLVQIINEPAFLADLEKYGKVIFDYSHSDEVNLDFDETKSFATLAKIHANFIDHLHIVISLSGPDGYERADYYRKHLDGIDWKVDIVDSFDEALKLLQ